MQSNVPLNNFPLAVIYSVWLRVKFGILLTTCHIQSYFSVVTAGYHIDGEHYSSADY